MAMCTYATAKFSRHVRWAARTAVAILFILIGGLVAWPTHGVAQEKEKGREQKLREQVEALQRQQEALQAQLDKLTEQVGEARKQPQPRTAEQVNALEVLHELDTKRADYMMAKVDPNESGFLTSGLFGGKFRVDFNGYIKFDANWADQELQAGDLLLSARANGTPLDNGQFTISPRETRLAVNFQGPKVAGAQSGGKIEFDFFGDIAGIDPSANSAQPTPVMRSGFFNLIWASKDGKKATELLVGQDFLPFGNWFPHLTTFAKGVDVGTYFLLAPQIRLIQRWRFGKTNGQEFRLSWAVARSTSGTFGLLGGLNTGNNFVGVGEQSGLPEFHFSALYSNDFLGKAPFWGVPTPFTLSVSGVYGQERLMAIGGVPGNARDFDKWGGDVKLFVPLHGRKDGKAKGTLSLKAYAAAQKNLNEGLGNGLVGIVVSPGGDPTNPNDLESAFAVAGWAELNYYVGEHTYLHALGGYLTNDKYDSVVEGFAFPTAIGFSGIRENIRITGSIKHQISNVLIGLDFTHEETEFMNNQQGETNNVLLGTYYFF